MAIATGNFAELLWPGINTIWGQTYTRYSTLYTNIFNTKKASKGFEKEQGVTNLPLAALKDQGDAVSYVNPYQGFQKEYVPSVYSIGVIVTREMVSDDQYGYINQLPSFLAESMRQTEETISFNVLNNGFSTSFLGPDGSALFASNHALIGGGANQRNQLSVASDLTQTSLEQMTQDIMDMIDDQSLKIRATPQYLVVPTQLYHRAHKILESQYVTGSADNDKNTLQGTLKLLVSPYLTDTDAWFVTTNVPNGLNFYRWWAAEIYRDNEFDTQNMKVATVSRFTASWTNWRSAFGTPGA